MDLNRIAVFAQVVEAGSFTAAAASLGLRKSSVSRAVAALEGELGIRLLQRTTRRLSLTDAGRAYYERTRDALAGLREASEEAAALGAEPRGTVRVTAPVDLAPDLARLTDAFLRAHPQVRVEVSLTARYVDLVKEGFDLAIRAGVLADSSLLARKLSDSALALFAAPSYLEARGRPRRLADLARHDCLLYRAGGETAVWRLTGRRGEEQVTVRGRAAADEFAFVRGMLLAGAGIALVPTGMVAAHLRTGALERVLPQYVRRGGPVSVVWPSRRYEPVAVARFRDAIVAALGEPGAGEAQG
ncbi:LysR family transcriptional regulator [Anaeromyxobacter dehalogenans]|uniref:Transcriptional regulator, LysR family n=1 Tax=Anaeromyxobacter dehalogenans (strain 2CP-C) TaxID=290397 RepID=Q2IK08_ANADE|nr:LysR family transcriptional regulator [Anaeromyxobacter dehalogenans]ABC81984.1 transcriptional regulator, LysR family [Anaeromyxobacter dehalogenans 2CP-C]